MTKPNPFRYFKTSPEIIRLAVMLYVRFPLSLRNVEDLLHERGIDVSHETVRFPMAGQTLSVALGHCQRDHRYAVVRTEVFRGGHIMSDRKKIRCAIYTRKSFEEGLDQDFNSLDAQREACEAYIASQKAEGWAALPEFYDDGGISGGTLERPALQRMLDDIDAGKVDQVVVYKIDRLTRSLADFAKLVERLEKAGAPFVSVTQSFNTATSMGRLPLNVLLSFAQFEREVTAERIRDKIAASKKKGLWMGGLVPFGYVADERTLCIVEPEAKTIRTLYDLYLELGTVREVQDEVKRRDLRTQNRTQKSGIQVGDTSTRY